MYPGKSADSLDPKNHPVIFKDMGRHSTQFISAFTIYFEAKTLSPTQHPPITRQIHRFHHQRELYTHEYISKNYRFRTEEYIYFKVPIYHHTHKI